jgi:hypothetical protein
LFSDNTTPGYGGGLFCGSASPIVSLCRFTRNTATWGAGVHHNGGSSPEFSGCVFCDNIAEGSGGGLQGSNSPAATVTNSIFANNSSGWRGGGAAFRDGYPRLTNCTFFGNSAPEGAGVICYEAGRPTLERTIIAFGVQGVAIHCDETSSATLTCCDVCSNEGGDWVGCIENQFGIDGNFAADPLFCDTGEGDYTLDGCSPCLPGNHPHGVDCGLIGALGQGCGATPVEESSWGRLKSFYRR